MTIRRVLGILAIGVVLAACTGSGGDGDSGGGTGSDSSPRSGPEATGTPLEAPGIEASVEVLGPPIQGAGAVPTFSWSAVPGAASYRLVVLDAEDGPVWAWDGTDTSVNLGGLPGERPVGEPGPVIEVGSSWTVVGLDAEGHAVAVSASRPVSP